jgi:hypothetical protein
METQGPPVKLVRTLRTSRLCSVAVLIIMISYSYADTIALMAASSIVKSGGQIYFSLSPIALTSVKVGRSSMG